jgi:peptidoglycan/xylan/chitin deacetylase (PgdA/CDA1 family)
MKRISISIDVEQDCPPMLETMRGIEEGLPLLMELLRRENIRSTFFTTGKVAELYPDAIARIPEEGHELGCHGYAHERFDRLNKQEAQDAISKAKVILGDLGAVVESFRAPNLKFPTRYIEILQNNDFTIDSSIAKYKPPFPRNAYKIGDITRIPASTTSSVIRLPLSFTLPLLARMKDPVLFVHPWEFVDMSQASIRYDCKFNTGRTALNNLQGIIRYFRLRNYHFLTVRGMVPEECPD